MAKFDIGDLVVLKSGSMRMCVEAVDGDVISTVWCNEGVIGRDNFAVSLLNKWEFREDTGGGRGAPRGDRGGDRAGGRPPYQGGDRGGDRDGGKPPYRGGGDRDRGGDRGGDDRPKKTGWDGKPREKKYFRKDD